MCALCLFLILKLNLDAFNAFFINQNHCVFLIMTVGNNNIKNISEIFATVHSPRSTKSKKYNLQEFYSKFHVMEVNVKGQD